MTSLPQVAINTIGFDSGTVLIVEDDKLMMDLLVLYLQEAGFNCITVSTAEHAWALLTDPQYCFDSVLLDRNLPHMSGLDLLKQIKSSTELMALPVIMETAEGSDDAIIEGLTNGAYYYLTKPVQQESLIGILKVAIGDYRRNTYFKKEVKNLGSIFKNCLEGRFQFQTLLDSQRLAIALANMFPQPERTISGLSALMTNAVEHGNLEIGYQLKSQLLQQERLIDEIDNRLELPAYQSRFGEIQLFRDEEKVVATISDQGNGFDWQPYLSISIERVFDLHGRGIAMAREMSFDKLEYKGNGNTVVCTTFY